MRSRLMSERLWPELYPIWQAAWSPKRALVKFDPSQFEPGLWLCQTARWFKLDRQHAAMQTHPNHLSA